MLALVVVLLLVVLLVVVVLTGLLRSHADILRSLHSLGAGVGDPGARVAKVALENPTMPRGSTYRPPTSPTSPTSPERSLAVHDLEGVTQDGEPVAVSMVAAELTLLVFLTSGCESCAGLWASLAEPAERALLPTGARVVVVTKGPDAESPANVARRSPRGLSVVMSTRAWADYGVLGSPYFVLVDGQRRLRAGEGVGRDLAHVARLARAAAADAARSPGGDHKRPRPPGLDGAGREAHTDEVLRAAGITPGHASLYPGDLNDVLGPRG
jgi:hypothetical protein